MNILETITNTFVIAFVMLMLIPILFISGMEEKEETYEDHL